MVNHNRCEVSWYQTNSLDIPSILASSSRHTNQASSHQANNNKSQPLANSCPCSTDRELLACIPRRNPWLTCHQRNALRVRRMARVIPISRSQEELQNQYHDVGRHMSEPRPSEVPSQSFPPVCANERPKHIAQTCNLGNHLRTTQQLATRPPTRITQQHVPGWHESVAYLTRVSP